MRAPDLTLRSSLAGEAQAAASEVEQALAVAPDPRAAAFFDVDNTIVQGASIYHLARGMYDRGFFGRREMWEALRRQVSFRLLGAENAGHVADARVSALGLIAGHPVSELQSLAEDVFDDGMAHRIWPGTRALAQIHLDRGERVWLVTAAPIEIAEVIAQRLGLTGAMGTVAEHVDGVYTGRLVGDLLHGPAKRDVVAELVEAEGLDPAACSAYSDSVNDLPLLGLVGHPCAVNPDRRLRRHAEEQGWPVRDYRVGRRAARAGLTTAGVAGALTLGAAAVAARRRGGG